MPLTCYDIPSLVKTPWVLYDISRLLRRAREWAPTGIDRIDLQVARALSRSFGERFVPITRQGHTADLPDRNRTVAFLEDLWALWRGDELRRQRVLDHVHALDRKWTRLRPRQYVVRQLRRSLAADGATYVCCSHSGLLTAGSLLREIRAAVPFRSMIYLHDLIPLDYPEYNRPEIIPRFRKMLETVMALNPQVLVNSNYTKHRVEAWIKENKTDGRLSEEVIVAEPEIDWLPELDGTNNGPALSGPYFVIIGTIEPRKNHHLLLHIWREWALENRKEIPHLYIIGKRGWENNAVFNFLDHCQVIKPYVHEYGKLNQIQTFSILSGARALLMPSFVEGLGLPVREALKLGKDVIVSDIPAFDGLEKPVHATIRKISPLDGKRWQEEIWRSASD